MYDRNTTITCLKHGPTEGHLGFINGEPEYFCKECMRIASIAMTRRMEELCRRLNIPKDLEEKTVIEKKEKEKL